MNRLHTNSHGEYMSIPGNSGCNGTVENATKIWLNCGPWAWFWTSSFSVPHGSWRYNALYDHFWWTTFKTSATYFNINEANLMILRHETCTVQGDNVFKYRCVTRGFQLMNIQSIRGKVLTASVRGVWRGWFKARTKFEFTRFISLPERCQSVNRQQSLIFFGGGGAKRSKDGDDGEACEWWSNLWNSASVLSRICKVWYLFSEKFIFALATEVWTFRIQWLPNIFLCVQGWLH